MTARELAHFCNGIVVGIFLGGLVTYLVLR